MKEIKCPYDLNQFLLGEPIFENPFLEEECEQRKFYGDCFHCFATAIASRDHQLKYETIDKIKVIVNRWKAEKGKIYKMSDVDVICIGYTKKGYAKMQTLGMTAGAWPGADNISDYNDVTRRFADEWKGVIKKFRLPTLEKAKVNKNVRTTLAKAAKNYSSFGGLYHYVWLGTCSSSGSWCVGSNGNIYYYYGQHYSFVIAPAFNLDTSKVILDGNRIKKTDTEAESEG